MVYFLSCSKKMKTSGAMLSVEVTRRKTVFAEATKVVDGLLKRHEKNPSRVLIAQAQGILVCARRWIELFEGELQSVELRRCLGETPRADPLFAMERIQLEDSFRVFPECFYMSPTMALVDGTQALQPSKNILRFAEQHANYLWQDLQEHMEIFVEEISPMNGSNENHDVSFYTNPGAPFRLFEHPIFVNFRDGTMLSLVSYLKNDPERSEAFRIAARNMATRKPQTTPFLHFMVHHLDHEFCTEDSGNKGGDVEETMSTNDREGDEDDENDDDSDNKMLKSQEGEFSNDNDKLSGP